MANYLITHYKGTYRIKAQIDQSTNTFPRKLDGTYEDIDCYIDCYNNIQIFYYGKRLLEAYIPSLGRGRNIIKNIYSDFVQDIETSPYLIIAEKENKDGELIKINSYDYDSLYHDEELNKIITDIYETDSEVLFKFNAKYMNDFEKYFKPKTSGASISPFSVKNLPSSDYTIPDEDLNEYKKLIENVPKEKRVTLAHITRSFLQSLATKKNSWDKIKADMALKGIKGKEYIHNIGKWNEYLRYLEKELKELCQN